jgi:hypothetical protein
LTVEKAAIQPKIKEKAKLLHTNVLSTTLTLGAEFGTKEIAG